MEPSWPSIQLHRSVVIRLFFFLSFFFWCVPLFRQGEAAPKGRRAHRKKGGKKNTHRQLSCLSGCPVVAFSDALSFFNSIVCIFSLSLSLFFILSSLRLFLFRVPTQDDPIQSAITAGVILPGNMIASLSAPYIYKKMYVYSKYTDQCSLGTEQCGYTIHERECYIFS